MKFDLPDSTQPHVVDQLLNKSWGELEALEHAGHLLFPEKIYRRVKSGEFEEIPVMIRVPRMDELTKARVQARRIAQEEGLDQKLDKDLVDDWEVICTLTLCVRDATEPFAPFEPDQRTLAKHYEKASLMQVWAKLDAYQQIINPAPDSISMEEIFALIAAIAKERNLSPFFVYGPGAQTSSIVFMADQFMSLLESKSSSEPSEPSTSESSQSQDSSRS